MTPMELPPLRILAVTNCYPTVEHPAQGTFIEQQVKSLRAVGMTVTVLTADRTKLGYRAYANLGARVRAEASGQQVDLVHVMYGGVMAQAVLLGSRAHPTVVSFCGSDLLGENLPGLLRRIAVAIGVRCSRRAAWQADGVVVKSKNLRNALPARVDRNRVRIIPNGVDMDRFRPMNPVACRQQLGWRPDRFHVLFPANSGSPVKRFWLAEAAANRAAASGVPVELHRLQGVQHADVPVWLNASDCVILTSEHEGSPNIVKEALACNRPVVSVDVGDVADRIAGLRGCHLSAPDAESLGRCLGLIHRTPETLDSREQMKGLSLDSVALNVVAFYRQTIDLWHACKNKH